MNANDFSLVTVLIHSYTPETRNKEEGLDSFGREDALLLQFPWLGRKTKSREWKITEVELFL